MQSFGECDAVSISVSIVSHGQGTLVTPLLAQLGECPEVAEVLLTRNLPDDGISVPPALAEITKWVDNSAPKGFGENHNAASAMASEACFCIMNPDIRLEGNPFPSLLDVLYQGHGGRTAVVAPLVVNPSGATEDSARHFPSAPGLLQKFFHLSDGRVSLNLNDAPRSVDWVAGMFMLVRREEFLDVGGFDDGFYLYYEDVDLCERLRSRGKAVMVCPSAKVIHDARRSSHRSLRYLRWHLRSLFRYFWKYPRRLLSSRL